MDLLPSHTNHFLSTILNSLPVLASLFLLVFVPFVMKKQRQAMAKFDKSLKNQDNLLRRFDLMLKELRQSNRFLAELADVEWTEAPIAPESVEVGGEQCPMHHHASSQDDASAPTGNEFKLYVGNIDYAATEAELAAYFAEYGTIESANIPVNRYTGRARGFGFVTFASREEAEKAMVLNGTTFKGRQIQVNFAKERDFSA